ncbi:tyrosine-type recombinase/integrase [Burkholderia ambifaria]|uniref:tyrosine-type recombinase/integrase n=1 Tax=Burkholderia ambifaria TaxID=152480 RepID=UPI001F49FCBE|nr:site-specific integrase [Burkholderia ambifaria]
MTHPSAHDLPATRAAVATVAPTPDFWPAQSLHAWERSPAETFLSWLAGQRVGSRQFRETSCETYAAMFAAWMRHLENHSLSLLEATQQDANDFFSLHALEPVSRRRYLQLLDKVYRQLRQVGWDRANPLREELKKERPLEVPLPVGLEAGDQAALVAALTDLTGWKGVRDRAVCALLLGAGLRANELIALPVDAVSETFRVRVEPQGVHASHTTLVVPDGPWRGWLRAWNEERARRVIPGVWLCPATLGGTPYSPSGLFRRLAVWFESAGINAPRQGAGILRNTFAKNALICGRYTAEEVQEFLGHEELRATTRHLGRDELL